MRAQQIPPLAVVRPADTAAAEALYAKGRQQETERRDACVDLYFQAAVRAWRELERRAGGSPDDPEYHAAWQVYQRSLARLIPAASRFARLDPRARLIVRHSELHRDPATLDELARILREHAREACR